ncbi:Uncharacterised protein [Mycobacterium tuberculosis]|nr:Uncharacterised protein [Mycobacterium tuberculosis]
MPGRPGVRPAGALPSSASNGLSNSTSAAARSAASSHTASPGSAATARSCNRRMVATNWPNPAPGLAGPYSGNPPWW